MITRLGSLAIAFAITAWPGVADASFNPTNVVPTYHCISVLCARQTIPADAPTTAAIRYRAGISDSWHEAQPLMYDSRDKRFVGSIVNLEPDTNYAMEVSLPNELDGSIPTQPVQIYQRTMKPLPAMEEILKDAQQIHVSPHGNDANPGTVDKPLHSIQHAVDLQPKSSIIVVHDGVYREQVNVTSAGQTMAPIRIVAADGEAPIIDGEGVRDHAISLNFTYGFRVHGLTMRNTRRSVLKAVNSTQVGLTSNTFSDPGDHYYDSAIEIGPGCRNAIIQGNTMTFPHRVYKSGGMGIALRNTSGGHIISDNRIVGDDRIKDGIGGEDNFGLTGGPYRDTDIYNNTISGCINDAIESEGAGFNVRIWGNHLSDSLVGLALAPVIQGPTYVWRNTIVNCGPAFKLGEGDHMGHGPLFLYHNTAWSTSTDNGGYAGSGGKGLFEHVTARNNLILDGGLIFYDRRKSATNSFDYDLLWPMNPRRFLEWGEKGRKLSMEDAQGMGYWNHAVVADPLLAAPPLDLTLMPHSPAIDAGVRLPNFNDSFSGQAPDIGAEEFRPRAIAD